MDRWLPRHEQDLRLLARELAERSVRVEVRDERERQEPRIVLRVEQEPVHHARHTRQPEKTYPVAVTMASVVVATLSILGSLAIAIVVLGGWHPGRCSAQR
ncbi:MAG: hypothetical protein HC783_06955 [Rhodobacteraceae bacterium]|nr:hypothetical protein [Paracoccaceae bacterium]